MKKKIKKLQLNRETLAQLEQSSLEAVAGGVTAWCEYSGYRTCGTCQATCTTNYC